MHIQFFMSCQTNKIFKIDCIYSGREYFFIINARPLRKLSYHESYFIPQNFIFLILFPHKYLFVPHWLYTSGVWTAGPKTSYFVSESNIISNYISPFWLIHSSIYLGSRSLFSFKIFTAILYARRTIINKYILWFHLFSFLT